MRDLNPKRRICLLMPKTPRSYLRLSRINHQTDSYLTQRVEFLGKRLLKHHRDRLVLERQLSFGFVKRQYSKSYIQAILELDLKIEKIDDRCFEEFDRAPNPKIRYFSGLKKLM